ncbi:MAG TPA: rRNA maturation RNase YbeY [Patescibacteria group bacterium]
MKIDVEVNNTTQSPIEDGFFVRAVAETFAILSYDFLEKKEILISIALVGPQEICVLNKDYRKYDSVTDILSFAEHESLEEIKAVAASEVEQQLFLGELILCYDDIKEYAERENKDFLEEMAYVTSHGVLHLLGFSHGEEMFSIQRSVAAKMKK